MPLHGLLPTMAKTKSLIADPGSLAALKDRTGEINQRRRFIINEILEAEKSGAKARPLDPEKSESRQRAIEMLNGAAAPHLPPADMVDPSGHLATLRSELIVVDEALSIAEGLYRPLAIREAAARFEERRDDWQAAMQQISLCLISLERALQRRDAISQEVKSMSPLAGEGWAFAGRLRDSGSMIYRFLQVGTAEGWISTTEFVQEVENARRP